MDKPDVTTNEIMDVLQKQQGFLLNQQSQIKDISDLVKKQSYDHTELMGFLEEHMVMKGEFESRMNTQKLGILDGVDDKLATLKGDLVVMMRNEDKKLMLMVQKLKQKEIFDDADVEEFTNLLPFPQRV